MGILPARVDDIPTQRNFDALQDRIFDLELGITQGLNALGARLPSGFATRDELAQPTVQTRDFQRTISSAENATVVIWIPDHAEKLGTVKARSNAGAKIPVSTSFSTLSKQTGPPPAPANDDWTGNYYILDLILPIGNKKLLSYIEILVTNNSGGTVHNETFEFDSDKYPDIKWSALHSGTYDAANDKWPYTFGYQGDEDTASVEWAVHTSPVGTPPSDAEYGAGVRQGCSNARQDDNVAIGNLDPDTIHYFILRGRGSASCAGTKGIPPDGVVSQQFKTPKLGKGVIPIEWLWQSMFQITFTGEFSWHGTDPYKRIKWEAGTITYSDGTAHTGILAGDKTLNATPQREFVYFDPLVSVTVLQWTTTFTDVFPTAANPNRAYIGEAKAAASTNSRAFFLANGTTNPLISAVYANFGSLTALFAVIGTLDIEDGLTLASGGSLIWNTQNKLKDDGLKLQAAAKALAQTIKWQNDAETTTYLELWSTTANAFLQNLNGTLTIRGKATLTLDINDASGNITIGNSSTSGGFTTVYGDTVSLRDASNTFLSGNGEELDASGITGSLHLPVGTTAQRTTPVNGMIRYNTTTAKFEGYEAGAWTNFI